jgi:hypothetical protein
VSDSEEWLAKELGKVQNKKVARPSVVVSRHRGVVAHSTKALGLGLVRWQARGRSGKFLGEFQSESAAAEAVARSRRCTVKSLIRGDDVPGKQVMTRAVARRLFSKSYEIFKVGRLFRGCSFGLRRHHLRVGTCQF